MTFTAIFTRSALIPFNREFDIVVVITLFDPIFIYVTSEFFLTPDSWSLILYQTRDVSTNVISNVFDDALFHKLKECFEYSFTILSTLSLVVLPPSLQALLAPIFLIIPLVVRYSSIKAIPILFNFFCNKARERFIIFI